MPVVADEAEDFAYIVDVVYDRSRIRLHSGKEPLIRARLGKRMRLLGIPTLHEYCELLRRDPDGEEMTHALDSLTTNFTHFLREEKHLQFLVDQALPAMLTKGQKRFNVWSAACSTGEEPYSLALYLAERYPLSQGWDWQIMATDISTKVLRIAEQGVYPAERLNALPAEWLPKYFQRGQGKWEGHYRLKRALTERVRFGQLNLLSEYHFKESFEVVFCRNVMIYFDRQTQEQLVNQMHRFIAPKGYLLIGHSESLNGLNIPLNCLRPSIYQKK